MAVNLFDPQDGINSTNLVNGIPSYEDMFLFVELVAERRGRTVLETNGVGQTSIYKTGLEKSVTINLLGFNQDPKSTNNLHHTSNWYSGSVPDGNQIYDAFGMTSIKITISASFVPQVNIEFVDVRGLSFFERDDSPYRVLFDFPPAIFHLTVKGYYGKAVTYQLHLVKNNTKFDAGTGNYIINSEFVGMTFAPLADVLLKYIVNFGIMNRGVDNPSNSTSTNFNNSSNNPRTTNALMLKVKDLYDNDNFQNLINTSTESTTYNNSVSKRESIDEFFLTVPTVNSFNKIPESFRSKGIIARLDSVNNVVSPITLIEYNEYIKNYGKTASVTKLADKLIIAFPLYDTVQDQLNIIPNLGEPQLISGLSAFGQHLLSVANKSTVINNNLKPKDAETIQTRSLNSIILSKTYTILDISDLYFSVYQNLATINNEVKSSQTALIDKINALVSGQLNIQPTIYNIFKILCDDVDYFFQRLRTTVKEAEAHHEKYKSQILNQSSGTYADNTEHIFAFPLCIKNDVRTYPKYISETLAEPFPELQLIDEFIQSFLQQKLDELPRSLRTQNDDTGNSKWIPISPLDSLFGGVVNNSPYFGIDPNGDGVNPNPIQQSIVNEVFSILMRRYYILSQYSFGENNDFNKDIIKFYAQTEAINLANSTANVDFINLIKTESDKYNSDNTVNNFYVYLQNNLPFDYNLNNGNADAIVLENTPNDTILVYRNKSNASFEGVSSVEPSSVKTEPRSDSSDLISEFLKDQKSGVIRKSIAFFFSSFTKVDTEMTKQNLFYIPDNNVEDNDYSSRYITFFTRFANINFKKNLDRNVPTINQIKLSPTIGLTVGNNGLTSGTIPIISGLGDPYDSQSWLDTWSSVYSQHDTKLLPIFNSGDPTTIKLVSLLYASNFGHTLSPFSNISSINYKVFNKPALLGVPYYVALYIGAIVEMIKDPALLAATETFFTMGVGSEIEQNGRGILIFADYHDVLNYLSESDKERFYTVYETFMNDNSIAGFSSINDNVVEMIDKVIATNPKNKFEEYSKELLGAFKPSISEILNTQYTIANNSDITFNSQYPLGSNIPNQYVSIQQQNTNTANKTINDNYFKEFFNTLSGKLKERNDLVVNIEKDFKKSTGDEDIWTQTYYSLKNIADRWIAGMNTDTNGYPFNNPSETLISKFAFVDRAMNPIGHVMIDPRGLADKADNDFDINVYTLMSEILSSNGFNFFPLSNFLTFSSAGWRDTFKPTVNLDNQSNTAFVCMFYGGESSYPNNLANGFINDGIDDVSTDPILNAEPKEQSDPTYDNQKETNPNFPYNQPLAFKVRFGQPNQSIFYDVQLDSKEYPETNESLQILSKIAGDNKQNSPVPKGQNLFTVYENRSYKAQVSMLGDVMIQPTQYFQLENIPMFSGAYMVLGVEHTITPNYMTTSFNGVKILKYPVPLVTSAAAVFGVDFGSTNTTSGEDSIGGSITPAQSANNAPPQAQYNSMYILPLSPA